MYYSNILHIVDTWHLVFMFLICKISTISCYESRTESVEDTYNRFLNTYSYIWFLQPFHLTTIIISIMSIMSIQLSSSSQQSKSKWIKSSVLSSLGNISWVSNRKLDLFLLEIGMFCNGNVNSVMLYSNWWVRSWERHDVYYLLPVMNMFLITIRPRKKWWINSWGCSTWSMCAMIAMTSFMKWTIWHERLIVWLSSRSNEYEMTNFTSSNPRRQT